MKHMNLPRFAAGRRGALALVLGFLLLGAGLAGCGGAGGQPDLLSVAAVDGHAISLSDYQTVLAIYQALDAQQSMASDWQSPQGRSTLGTVQQQALDFLINLELMRDHLKTPVSAKAMASAHAQLMSTRAQLVQQEPATLQLVNALTPRGIEIFAQQSAIQTALLKQNLGPELFGARRFL